MAPFFSTQVIEIRWSDVVARLGACHPYLIASMLRPGMTVPSEPRSPCLPE